MVNVLKMQLLRVLVSERLSAAADDIFKIVERMIVEYEEDSSHSKWVVDSHRKLLDVGKSHRADPQISATEDNQQPPAMWNFGLGWAEPENATSEPPDDRQNISAEDPDSSPATSENDRETSTDNVNLRPKKSYKCPVSTGSFSSKKTVLQHVRMHSEDKSAPHQCHFCDRYFCQKSDLVVHTRTHTGQKPYECQDCHKCFAQKGNLVIHMRKHRGEKEKLLLDHQAEAESHSGAETLITMEEEVGCSQRATLAQSLEPKLKIIKAFPLALPPYEESEFDQESLQPLCLYQIQTVEDLDGDSSAVEQIQTGSDTCTSDHQPSPPVHPSQHGESEEETRTSALWSELKHFHVKRSLSWRKPPARSAELNVHFEAGTVQKPYKCPHCGKCFSLTKTLIRHVKIHTEDKTYRCQFCERNFCQKSDLVTHTRTHTGERPYRCPECQKSFTQKGNLVVHMRKHTGEKPYQCQECHCCFSQKASLDCHMQSHI